MASFKVEQVLSSPMSFIGDCPFFNVDTNVLYYVDTLGGSVYHFDYNTNKTYTARILGEHVISFIVPVYGNEHQFVVGAGKRLLLINWDGITTMATITRVLAELPVDGLRFNDGKTDSKGRLYLGTMISEEMGEVFDMHKRVGSFYKYTVQGGLVELKKNVGLSNGMAWNDKTNKFYFCDSYDLNVKEYDFDVKTGTISGEKILCDLTKYGQAKRVFPDGLTIDQQGYLYCAMFGGSKIFKINTVGGKIEGEIHFPVSQITSMTFGGKQLDTMFVTTSGQDMFLGAQTTPSGYLFKVTNFGGVKGTQQHQFLMN
ncbi:unnamed protein product [Diamesa serratosioi]